MKKIGDTGCFEKFLLDGNVKCLVSKNAIAFWWKDEREARCQPSPANCKSNGVFNITNFSFGYFKMINLAPSKIDIPFEYEHRTCYYTLELEDTCIPRVRLDGIHEVLVGMDDKELREITIAYSAPTTCGWRVEWRITGAEFLDKSILVEIK